MNLKSLTRQIVNCNDCPRLRTWCVNAGRKPPPRHAGETYWAKPVPGFGDPNARLLIVGLAPAANGANRTGRMFTGDRSGEWLYRALHKAGFANQPTSVSRTDGLKIKGAYVSAIVRCAPPANKPTPKERDQCLPYFEQELTMLANLKVILALGQFAWDGIFRSMELPKPKFGHGAEAKAGRFKVIGSYHPSQQNTFTGKLTEPMFDRVFERARRLVLTD